jgi:drug/metabolite transporter (DMT)-like permease
VSDKTPLLGRKGRDWKMNSLRRSSVTEIPRDLLEQEPEIEQIFLYLLRRGSSAAFPRLQSQPNGERKEEVGAWILIAVLGIISTIAFYLLWAKA